MTLVVVPLVVVPLGLFVPAHISLRAAILVAARIAVPLVRRAAALVVERLRGLVVVSLALARARRWAGLVVALRPVPVTAPAAVGLLLAVIRGAAAPGSAVLAVLVLLLILTGSAVPVPVAVITVVAVGSVTVVLNALVPVCLPVIGLVRPLRT